MRFPDDISYGAVSSPMFATEVVRVMSGAEKRNRLWSTPLYSFECSHGVKSQQQLNELIDFFYDVGGRHGSFRFKNWAEYQLTKTNCELQRPTTESLYIYKKYGSNVTTRRITKIVDGTFKLYADDVLVTSGYSLDIDTGIITLAVPGDYAPTVIFTCECEFDFWCRFNSDSMPSSIDNVDTYSWVNIEIIEDRQ